MVFILMLVAFLVIITIAMVGLSLTFSGKSARHISLREMIKYEKKK